MFCRSDIYMPVIWFVGGLSLRYFSYQRIMRRQNGNSLTAEPRNFVAFP